MTHFAQIASTQAAAALIGAMAIASLIAPAQADNTTAGEQFVRQICQSVIQVQPGESEFDGCVSSIVRSLESTSRARAAESARDACFEQGLKSGSADLSLCLLGAADREPGPVAVDLPGGASVATGRADDLQSSESFFAVSPDIKFRREQRACAQLGFDPAFGAFANCVASLESTLQGIEMPSG